MEKKAIIIDGKWFKNTEYPEFQYSKFVRVLATENFQNNTYNVLDAFDNSKILFIVPAEKTYDIIDVQIEQLSIYEN